MNESELIFLLASALQEAQWYMLMEDEYPAIYVCPACEKTQTYGKHLDHRGTHLKGCIVDQALSRFDEWVMINKFAREDILKKEEERRQTSDKV